jgi:excisionase family DNA binding protein
MPRTEHEPPLTVSQAAEFLQVSPSTIYALCAAGKLAHSRIGVGRGTIRIKKETLVKLIDEGQQTRPGEFEITLADLREAL